MHKKIEYFVTNHYKNLYMPIIGWVSLQTTGIVFYKFSQGVFVEIFSQVVFLYPDLDSKDTQIQKGFVQ